MAMTNDMLRSLQALQSSAGIASAQGLGLAAHQSMSKVEWDRQMQQYEEARWRAQFAAEAKAESKPVPPPEPNKVLLLLGDDE